MINTPEKLISIIRLQYRFIKNAANTMGFLGAKDYQRFRNTLLGASRDYQVIMALLQKYPKIDTVSIWSLDKSALQNAKTYARN
ncbi:MAG: hypothetical protein ABUK01_16590 [Leptospirales bacterium]